MATAARGRALAIDPALTLAALAAAPAVRAPALAVPALAPAVRAPAPAVPALALAVRVLALAVPAPATAAVVEWRVRWRAQDLALLIGGASPDCEWGEFGIDGLPAGSAGGAVARCVSRRWAEAAQRA